MADNGIISRINTETWLQGRHEAQEIEKERQRENEFIVSSNMVMTHFVRFTLTANGFVLQIPTAMKITHRIPLNFDWIRTMV